MTLTGADTWTLADGTSHPTGFWAEEFVEPMRVFGDAGVDMTVATPGGVAPTVDEASLSADGAGGEDRAAELRAALDALSDMLAAPAALEDISPADFEGVFVPGGHGPMEDLAASPELGRMLITMLDDDKVIAAVCHGPAALLSAERDDGSWAFSGRALSAFTNEEETQAGLAGSAPWLLEDRLREAGGTVATAQVAAVLDRRRKPRHRAEPALQHRSRAADGRAPARQGALRPRRASPREMDPQARAQ